MIDLKKIADEISEKCEGAEVYISVSQTGWSKFDTDSMSLHIDIGGQDYHRLDVTGVELIPKIADLVSDEWIATKEEREKAQIEAARALLAKHGEVSE